MHNITPLIEEILKHDVDLTFFDDFRNGDWYFDEDGNKYKTYGDFIEAITYGAKTTAEDLSLSRKEYFGILNELIDNSTTDPKIPTEYFVVDMDEYNKLYCEGEMVGPYQGILIWAKCEDTNE